MSLTRSQACITEQGRVTRVSEGGEGCVFSPSPTPRSSSEPSAQPCCPCLHLPFPHTILLRGTSCCSISSPGCHPVVPLLFGELDLALSSSGTRWCLGLCFTVTFTVPGQQCHHTDATYRMLSLSLPWGHDLRFFYASSFQTSVSNFTG